MDNQPEEKCRVCINEYCDGHRNQIANIRQRLKSQPTDFIIEIDQQEFPVHRLIMAMHSAFLAKLVYYGETVPSHTMAKLNFITCADFTTILAWMYSGQIPLCCGNVIALYAAAKHYDIPKLLTLCMQFMIANPGCSIIYAWKYTEPENPNFTKIDVVKLINNLLPDAAETSDFQQIDKEALLDILSSEYLSVDSENIILWVILRWISEDQTYRHEYMPEMISIVREERLEGTTASDVMNNCNVRVEESMLPLFTEAMLLLRGNGSVSLESIYVQQKFEESVSENITDVSETRFDDQQEQSLEELTPLGQLDLKSELLDQQEQSPQESSSLEQSDPKSDQSSGELCSLRHSETKSNLDKLDESSQYLSSLEQSDTKSQIIEPLDRSTPAVSSIERSDTKSNVIEQMDQSSQDLSSLEKSDTKSNVIEQSPQSSQTISSSEHSVTKSKSQLIKEKRTSSESSCFSCFKSCCGNQRDPSQQSLSRSHPDSYYYKPAAEPTIDIQPPSSESALESSPDEAQTSEGRITPVQHEPASLQMQNYRSSYSEEFLRLSRQEIKDLEGVPEDGTPSDQSSQSSKLGTGDSQEQPDDRTPSHHSSRSSKLGIEDLQGEPGDRTPSHHSSRSSKLGIEDLQGEPGDRTPSHHSSRSSKLGTEDLQEQPDGRTRSRHSSRSSKLGIEDLQEQPGDRTPSHHSSRSSALEIPGLQEQAGDRIPSHHSSRSSTLEIPALQEQPDDRTPSDQSLHSSKTELPKTPTIGEIEVQRMSFEEDPVDPIQLGSKPLTANEVIPGSVEEVNGPSAPAAESPDGRNLISVVTRAYSEDATPVTRTIIPKMTAGPHAVILEMDIKCPACNDGNDGKIVTMQVMVDTSMLRTKNKDPDMTKGD